MSARPGTRSDTVVLFDGTALDGWRMAGPGGFDLVDGVLESRGGMGLLWWSERTFSDFVLDVHWQVTRPEDNSGVFLRFPDPGDDPWIPVHEGYEVQILDRADDADRLTGAIYQFAGARPASNPPGAWNHFRIRCAGQDYGVQLNGVEVTRFRGDRRLEGFVGLQNHDAGSTVRFRRVAVTL